MYFKSVTVQIDDNEGQGQTSLKLQKVTCNDFLR